MRLTLVVLLVVLFAVVLQTVVAPKTKQSQAPYPLPDPQSQSPSKPYARIYRTPSTAHSIRNAEKEEAGTSSISSKPQDLPLTVLNFDKLEDSETYYPKTYAEYKEIIKRYPDSDNNDKDEETKSLNP
ncbi:hypothetical protein ACQ4LE_003850 [Meloidogyne hapla]